MADPALLYATLLGQGLIWTTGHCLGMCGPLIVALRFGAQPDGSTATAATVVQLLSYQAGRCISLGTVGAGLGWLGASAGASIRPFMPLATLVAAAVCLVLALVEAGWLRLPTMAMPAPLARLASHAQSVLLRRGWPAALVLGLGLAFLPCAVTAWALTLAAASGHPMHGALLMVLLVALTTPFLLVAALIPAGLSRWRLLRGRWLVPAGLLLSAAILATMALRDLLAPAGAACHV